MPGESISKYRRLAESQPAQASTGSVAYAEPVNTASEAPAFQETTPQPAAQKVAQRAGFMAQKVNLTVKGVIENMSWFTGDDGKRYELFGRGGGQVLADRLGVPLLGQVPLIPALRAGGDDGRPITAVDPESEAARIFRSIAERVAVELAPTRKYRRELKII